MKTIFTVVESTPNRWVLENMRVSGTMENGMALGCIQTRTVLNGKASFFMENMSLLLKLTLGNKAERNTAGAL